MPTFRRRVSLLVLTGALALTGTTSARGQAAPTTKKAIWGVTQVAGASQFPLYRQLGAGIFEQQLSWADTATTRPANPRDPADPAYTWPADTDYAVREAAANGMTVMLQVGRAPRWANGSDDTAVPPTRPSDYADFVAAAARRYPQVHRWMIYGEPIRLQQFRTHPQPDDGSRGTGPIPARSRSDVRKYASILDASYVALKAVSRSNLVIGGNTTTSGDISPYNWIRYMRLANGKAPRMDLFGHNPFGARRPDLSSDPLSPGTADFSDLDTLLGWIDRSLARGGRNRRLRLFISEYSAPVEVKNPTFPYFVTSALQASWLHSALNIARRPRNRIATLGWFRYQDSGPAADGSETRLGLVTAQGARRPSYYVFQRG